MEDQTEFDEKYISASEIMRTLGVTRGGLLYARRVGKLPNGISVNDGLLFIWKREKIKPYLDAWREEIKIRKGKQDAYN